MLLLKVIAFEDGTWLISLELLNNFLSKVVLVSLHVFVAPCVSTAVLYEAQWNVLLEIPCALMSWCKGMNV